MDIEPLPMPQPVASPLNIRDVTMLLVKHYGFREGSYDLWFEYQFGVGNFGPNPENMAPGVAVGLSKIGLVRAAQIGPFTVDAAEVNVSAKIATNRRRKSEK